MFIEASSASVAAQPRVLARVRSLQPPTIALALTIAALIPRCIGLSDFYTIDEAYHWPQRVQLFVTALHNRDWAATNITGHPGVTVMWLGAVGEWLDSIVGLHPPGLDGGAHYLALLRLPLAISNSLAVALGYLLLRRLVPPSTALIAGILWALSPFLIAHGRLLHLDALLTSFMTLSVLLLLVAINTERTATDDRRSQIDQRRTINQWSLVAASGACAGLALLTKGPSLALLPFSGISLLFLAPHGGLWNRFRWTLNRYGVWLTCGILVVVVGWPAMWVTPRAAIEHVINEIVQNGGSVHELGNYFRGAAVGDPGWLFYPTVIVWLSTPVTLIGLALLPLALLRRSDERRTLVVLLGYVLFFGAALSMGPKKFERYLLPAWPALEVLAAAGLAAMVDLGSKTLHRGLDLALIRHGATAVLVLVVASVLLITDLRYHPYYLSYYNPLLGGSAAAPRVLLVGWGEGLEQVGAWLNQRPDIKAGPILARNPPTLEPFVPVKVRDLDQKNLARGGNYAVFYIRELQRGILDFAAPYTRETPPLYTLRLHGIDYAAVYQLPRPFTDAIDVEFAGGLHLRGISHELRDNTLIITPSWNIKASQAASAVTFVHVLAADGTKVAQADVPLDGGLFGTWQAGQQLGESIDLPLPAKLPPGDYRVVMGTYRLATGERLALARGTALPETFDGPNTVQLMTFTR